MKRVLILTGGPDHAHDFSATSGALADLFDGSGHITEVVDDPDLAAERLADGYDSLVVNALRWGMRGDAYDPWRAQWEYRTPQATRDSIEHFVDRGGGLLANHTAPICFDDWPGWGKIVGGSWEWGVSSHPPVAPVWVTVTDNHDVVAGLPTRFELVDEVYGDLRVRADVRVLATAKRTDDDEDQPVVWTHEFGRGRVVFDGFGHDAASIGNAEHARLLVQALNWIMEDT